MSESESDEDTNKRTNKIFKSKGRERAKRGRAAVDDDFDPTMESASKKRRRGRGATVESTDEEADGSEEEDSFSPSKSIAGA